MKKFQSKKGLVILATIILLICISLTVRPVEEPNIFQRGVQTVFLPIQNIVMLPINSVKDSVSFFAEMNHYEEENKKLLEENKKLKDEIRQIENAKKENEELRKLLSLSEKYNTDECIIAEVITKDVGIWVDTLIISKGLDANITVDSIVLTYDGLVGKVSEVYENSSKVITILDSTNHVGTRIAKTGEYVTASGDINLKSTGMLRLDYITSDVPLVSGDVVETAGIGGIYPEGIFIGTVKDVESDILTTYATVEPGGRFWFNKRSFNIEKVEVQSKLKQLILGIILIIAYVLQLTLVSEIQIFGVHANFLLIVTCAIAFLFGSLDGGIVGAILGIMLDLYQGRAIGLSSLLFMYLGVFIGGFNKKFFKDNYLILLILTIFATISYETVFYMFSVLAYSQNFMLLYLLKNLFLITVINILFGTVIYPILLKINIGLEVHRNIFR